MRTVRISSVSTPEGETLVVQWHAACGTTAPVDLIVWPGGGFTDTLAAFRIEKTRHTLHIFKAGQT